MIDAIQFVLHDETSAPAESRPVLAAVQKQFGFVPNLLRVLAESPAAAQGYVALVGVFDSTSLSAEERHVVLQTTNLANECHYCVPAHGALAGRAGLGALDAALRAGTPLGSPRLEALRAFTREVVRRRGAVPDAALGELLSAGYGKRQVLEILVGVAMKTLSNYANHLARTPVDAVFSAGAAA
jgi:uncharacterized peroxidase-related enzyme